MFIYGHHICICPRSFTINIHVVAYLKHYIDQKVYYTYINLKMSINNQKLYLSICVNRNCKSVIFLTALL